MAGVASGVSVSGLGAGGAPRRFCSAGFGGAVGPGGDQVADANRGAGCAQPDDFLVLGGQPRQRELLELQQASGGQLGDVQALLEAVVTRIAVLPAGRGLRDLLFELLLQAGMAAV